VLTPLDIERDFGLTEGNIFQGELTLEQLFFLRPVPAGRSTRRRSIASTCAARRRIRAAASWARRARTPPNAS
jgi:phytoene dehydrogenase-like protein